MSFNNYKPDIAVVRNAAPTAEQLDQLQDLGLTVGSYLTSKHTAKGRNFAALVGGIQSYYVAQEAAAIAEALSLESELPTYPEYEESDAVFDTIDALIEALKP